MGDPYRDARSRTQGRNKSKQQQQKKKPHGLAKGRQADARPDLRAK